MRRNVRSASMSRPCSGGRHSGGANSVASQSINSYGHRTSLVKKASGSCRSAMCDQNSAGGSSYQRNIPATPNNSNSPTAKCRSKLRRLRPKPNVANDMPKAKRCCRRRKVNSLRQCAANRFGELSKNPFINFFRAYKRKHADMQLIEVASRVAKIWNNMSEKQKVKYQLPAGYTPTGSGGGYKRGGGTKSGHGFGASGRRPRRIYNIVKASTRESISPDPAEDLYSDQTMPSSRSISRSRSNSRTASLSD